MIHIRFESVVLAFLVLVLLLGGASAAGFAGNALLQILGACLIGYCLWHRNPEPRHEPNKSLKLFGFAFILLAAVQFLPLPPVVWSHLPGRQSIAAGFVLLGEPLPWLTLSLAPWSSLASLGWLIPAVAFLVVMTRADRPSGRAIVRTIVTVAVLAIALGAMQRSSGAFYPYVITNYGLGTGFFANSNHQASFLLVTIAFWAGNRAAAGSTKTRADRRQIDGLVYYSVLTLLVIGVILSNSMAGLGLLVPVLISAHLIVSPGWRPSRLVTVIGLASVLLAIAAVAMLPTLQENLDLDAGTPGNRRQDYLATGLLIIRDFAPFGSGIGTFERVYHWYESVVLVGRSYVNHAHNDLLELVVETGLFGLFALATFLRLWIPAARSAWDSRGNGFAKAAVVVIAVELLHSLVDYPLRTAAMSSLFVIAMGFILRPERVVRPHKRARDAAPLSSPLLQI